MHDRIISPLVSILFSKKNINSDKNNVNDNYTCNKDNEDGKDNNNDNNDNKKNDNSLAINIFDNDDSGDSQYHHKHNDYKRYLIFQSFMNNKYFIGPADMYGGDYSLYKGKIYN